jgi:hypothetical protein
MRKIKIKKNKNKMRGAIFFSLTKIAGSCLFLEEVVNAAKLRTDSSF